MHINSTFPLKILLRWILLSILKLRTLLFMRFLFKPGSIVNLDLGSGAKSGSGNWYTIDLGVKCDFTWDLRQSLPVPAGSLNCVMIDHMLEHLDYNDSLILLKKIKLLLRDKSLIYLSVPDAKIFAESYLYNKPPKPLETCFEGSRFAIKTGNSIDYLNFIAYMAGEHRQMFDAESLASLLKKAGYSGTVIHSSRPKTIPFNPDREEISCYVSGVNTYSSIDPRFSS